MKNLICLWIALCINLFLVSCEKDNITNRYIEENKGRLDKVSENFRKTIASSENGWVMMVKSSLSKDVYSPVVLKFDTATNRVYINTVYGVTAATEDYFRIANGTGAPQLIFTTGSIMSTLFRVGEKASDITDHIYNVKSVSENEIQIQSYRSGNVYAKEGGNIYKLFKRPAEWKWADAPLEFDWTNTSFKENVNGELGQMKIVYLKDSITSIHDWIFWSWQDPIAYRVTDPFSMNNNSGTGGFKPMNFFIITGPITEYKNVTVANGHNAISLYPTPYYLLGKDTEVLAKKLKTHYLILKNQKRVGNNVKMDFEAYDKDGNTIVKAFYDNLK